MRISRIKVSNLRWDCLNNGDCKKCGVITCKRCENCIYFSENSEWCSLGEENGKEKMYPWGYCERYKRLYQ